MNPQHPSWDVAKGAQREKFIEVNTYIKKEEESQINNFTLRFKELQ